MLKIMNKKTSEMTGFEAMRFTVILASVVCTIWYGVMAIILKWSDIVDWFDRRIHRHNDELGEMNLEEDELD